VLQQTAFPNKIRVVESYELYGRLYGSNPNAKKLLERFALTDKAGRFLRRPVGGQKQKTGADLADDQTIRPSCFWTNPPLASMRIAVGPSTIGYGNCAPKGGQSFSRHHYIHEAEQLADRVGDRGAGEDRSAMDARRDPIPDWCLNPRFACGLRDR
jgi:hypothetical protein